MQAGAIYVGECLTRGSNAEEARCHRGCRVRAPADAVLQLLGQLLQPMTLLTPGPLYPLRAEVIPTRSTTTLRRRARTLPLSVLSSSF